MNLNTKKVVLIGASALAVVGGIGIFMNAEAHRGPSREGGFSGIMMSRFFDGLNLTEEQELKLIRVRRDLKDQAKQMHLETHASMKEAIGELGKEQPDTARLHSIADESMKRLSTLVHTGIDRLIEVHATLSAEQRASLTQKATNFHDKAARLRSQPLKP